MTTYSAKALPSEVKREIMHALGAALSANDHEVRSGMLGMVDSQEKAVLVLASSP